MNKELKELLVRMLLEDGVSPSEKEPETPKPAPVKEETPVEEKEQEDPVKEEEVEALRKQLADKTNSDITNKIAAKLSQVGIETENTTELTSFINLEAFKDENGEINAEAVEKFTTSVTNLALRKPPTRNSGKQESTYNSGSLSKYLEEKK